MHRNHRLKQCVHFHFHYRWSREQDWGGTYQVDLTTMQDDGDEKSLANLPTELLVKILSYLLIHDKITTWYVSRRFKNVSEMPLLWKEFLWPDYEPRHVCIVSSILKAHGKHMRQIFFPAHVTPANILEMARCCTNITHLNLPKNTQFGLNHLEKIAHAMTKLPQLDVFFSGILKCIPPDRCSHKEVIKQHFEVTAPRVKNLILRVDQPMNY